MAGKRYGYLVIACLIMLVLGLIYAWSIFVVPLEAEFGWNRTETAVTFTVMLVCFTIGQATGSAVGKKLGKKKAVLIMGVLLFIGFLATSFTNSLLWLYISLGAICGYPIGCCLNNTLMIAMQWFPDKPAFRFLPQRTLSERRRLLRQRHHRQPMRGFRSRRRTLAT